MATASYHPTPSQEAAAAMHLDRQSEQYDALVAAYAEPKPAADCPFTADLEPTR